MLEHPWLKKESVDEDLHMTEEQYKTMFGSDPAAALDSDSEDGEKMEDCGNKYSELIDADGEDEDSESTGSFDSDE